MKHYDKNENNYDDIIDLPHHVSKTHPQMSIHDRSAQFSPFAALTGYEDAIQETARVTDQKPQLDENENSILDEKLQMILEQAENQPEITLTYFKKDDKKEGGSYMSKNGRIRKIDEYERSIVFTDGSRIEIENIMDILT